MNKINWIVAIGAMVALLAFATACAKESTPTPAPSVAGGAQTGVPAPSGGAPTSGTGVIAVPPAPSGVAAPNQYAGYVLQQVGTSQAGIWVTGQGKVSATPDLALLNLGVESRAKTVSEAQEKAATAMNAIVEVLRKSGVADKDIQTRYFNIQPEYVWNDFAKRQEITGYRVTNTVAVKVRKLDSVGRIIDDASKAGGDLTRINSISFTIEDTTALATQAREKAVKDALAKAKQFAELTGVTLGRLVYISESGGGVPIVRDFGLEAKALGAPAQAVAPTPISTGELDIQINVQAVFNIL